MVFTYGFSMVLDGLKRTYTDFHGTNYINEKPL